MSTLDDVIDVLHGAGIPGFTYDPAVDPPIATVHGGDFGSGVIHYWANCRRCWWWCEDDNEPSTTDIAVAQLRADAHNRQHHPDNKETSVMAKSKKFIMVLNDGSWAGVEGANILTVPEEADGEAIQALVDECEDSDIVLRFNIDARGVIVLEGNLDVVELPLPA